MATGPAVMKKDPRREAEEMDDKIQTQTQAPFWEKALFLLDLEAEQISNPR